jgi:hypothetical protein
MARDMTKSNCSFAHRSRWVSEVESFGFHIAPAAKDFAFAIPGFLEDWQVAVLAARKSCGGIAVSPSISERYEAVQPVLGVPEIWLADCLSPIA